MDWCAQRIDLLTNRVRLHRGYALAAAALLPIEIVIALFVRDSFVRPVLGDVLAVVLVYCALLSVINLRRWTAALFAFLVGVVIEIMQYVDALTLLGLQDNPIARIVLGTTFTWEDIAAYAVGALIAVSADAALTARLEP